MTTFDVLLRGGQVVDTDGIRHLDLALRNGKITARLTPNEPAEAAHIVRVGGRFLLPGLVDAHVHLREPGMTWKEDFASGTQAAIAGGVTTVLVMPTDEPWTVSAADFKAKRALAEGRIFCDVGLQVAVGRDRSELAELANLGATSFEIFTSDVPPDFLHASTADLQAAVEAVRAAGGMVAISPGDQSVLDAELARLTAGRSTAADFVRSRPGHAEAQGIARAILAAATAGAPVHIRQSNSRQGMAAYRRLRDLADVSIETSPQCLMFTASDYERLGPAAKASPPWRDAADREAVRAAVADGVIDIIVTDHAPHLMAEKLAQAEDFAAVPGGFPGVQTLLATLLMLVDDGLIGLSDLVRLAASRPAERFGLGSHKGRLQVGFDADVLVLDPDRPTVIRGSDQLSKAGYTPFEGLSTSFSLERVFLRGQEVPMHKMSGKTGFAGMAQGLVVMAER
ncbi:dihydroorotase [Mesorhizobium tianshanense]|uniref:Dihydroorotase/allantoinase n=1 Tax=Mesorhizobium tianshanense TaxID=39844 RepID=A0A562N6Z6_9HYPH|nr:dihydroorotase family protein [Mesorhizobium tianshanense]TWI27883.1 dihydroorotase/allantoinase [Mesorhizobium tianshanense]